VQDQRAATIHPSTLEMLDEFGLVEKIRAHSLLSSSYRFHDRPTGDVVAEFDLRRVVGMQALSLPTVAPIRRWGVALRE
jgi:3-(3-hydroxy-phenyl)propionate hydroxylase